MRTPLATPSSTGPRKTPTKIKVLIGICALYLLSPVDVIPDVLPVIGQCDDLVAFFIAVRGAIAGQGAMGGGVL